MVLYRDLGFISQEQYELVDSKCKDHGSVLPDDCVKLMDEVFLFLFRLMNSLMDSIFMTLLNLAMKTATSMVKNYP